MEWGEDKKSKTVSASCDWPSTRGCSPPDFIWVDTNSIHQWLLSHILNGAGLRTRSCFLLWFILKVQTSNIITTFCCRHLEMFTIDVEMVKSMIASWTKHLPGIAGGWFWLTIFRRVQGCFRNPSVMIVRGVRCGQMAPEASEIYWRFYSSQ